MDTNRIRYFLSLSQTGSLTKAAELHHISPAAFSKAMKVFEAEVGETLILPHGRGLILTDYARSIVPELTSIIKQIDGIKEKKIDSARLRIATFEVFSTHFMGHALRDQFQDYKIEVQELVPGKMEEAVALGKADIALTYIPIPHPELDFLKVQEIEMGVFGKSKLFDKFEMSDIPFAAPLGPVEGSPNKVRGLDGWPDEAHPRNIQYQVTLLETALGLCREGLAVAYIPKFIAKLHNETVKTSYQLEQMKLPKAFPKRHDFVYLIKRKSDVEGTVAKKMAQVIRKYCS